MTDRQAASLLITGAYGTGKSTLAAELVELLGDREVPCAAIDLDWLDWAWLPEDRPHGVNHLVLANLRAVAETYARAGVTYFVVAGTVRSRSDLEKLAVVLPGPVRVVRLTVPFAEIERRLSADALSSRVDDLRVSASEPDAGAEIADLTLPNEGSIFDLAQHVLDWLGWPTRTVEPDG